MIDHISIEVRDLERAGAFYLAILGELGLQKLVEKPGTIGFGKTYPEFWLNQRAEIAVPGVQSGCHICLRGQDKSRIDGFWQAALDHGGEDDGAPGMRLEYNPHYYAAFVRDLDGNRIEAVTFLR